MRLAVRAGLTLLLAIGAVALSARVVSAAPPVAHFSVSVDPTPVRPGEVATVVISARIDPPFHIYSVYRTPGDGPIPTTIEATLPANGAVAAVAGPPSEDAPQVHYDEGFLKNVAYHENEARFTLPLRISADATAGRYPLTVTVGYQACNATFCDPPAKATLESTVTVAPGPVRRAYADVPPPSISPFPNAGSSPQPSPKREGSGSGLFGFVAAAFAAGLLALLTPCVFPLIPVTFGFFTKQLGASGKKLVALASTYSIGIVVSFTLLGLIVAATVGENGPNRIAANPWFNILFGLLFVVFGFAFFETFTIGLPGFLQRFASPARSGSGYATVLLMGLAFVFAAFTCTAPFVATVLSLAVTAAHSGGWLRPVLGMAFFALALALPFFVLALFPKLLSHLPKSGSWLSVTKAVLGFVELGFAVLYFSKADLVWQAHLLTRPVIFGIWAAIAVCGALYLIGALRVSKYQDEVKRLTAGRIAGAAVFAAIAVYCFYAQSGRRIDSDLGAFLPPPGYGGVAEAGARGDLDWLSDYRAGLREAQASGKPVFIDFTGYTCTNCRWMELNIFPKPEVDTLLRQFVTVRLYTDGGADGPRNQNLQIHMTGEVAQPLYAVVAPDGTKVAQAVGLDSNARNFAAFLAGALALAQAAPPAMPLRLADSAPPLKGEEEKGAVADAWAPYTAAALKAGLAAHAPMIVDFSADWCVPCHAIERTVFADSSVIALTPKFRTYKANLTDYDGPASTKLENQFGIVALPTIVFIDAAGHEAPDTRVTGLIQPADFAGRMRKTLASD